MLRSIAQRYSALLRERPIATNASQGAVLGALGDVGAQYIEQGDTTTTATMDSARTARAATIGAFWTAFLYPAVYGRLDAAFPGVGAREVVLKALSDIALFGVFGNAASLSLRGSTPAEVQQKMPGVLVNELRVWLPYNLFAFRIIPVHVRPTTTACLSLGWHTYMSYTAADGGSSSS